jgi:hypothetical protein
MVRGLAQPFAAVPVWGNQLFMSSFRLGIGAAMGFNRRKLEAELKAKADAEAANRRATDAQVPNV